MNPAEWPALQGVEFPCRIAYRRAAYGKIHRATTDFRWIGASLGFSKYRKQLREFFVPDSQSRGDIPLWWSYEGRYYASFCRSSRAADPEGRRGLETQILEWTPDEAPPALAALVLLPAVADLTDVDWFDTWQDPRWQDQDYEVTFQPARIEVSAEEAEAAVRDGLETLRAISEKHLAQFFSDLLTGAEPSALPGFEKPIPPRGLAALLLAARPEEAARWNLAGWPVSNARWSGAICASPLPPVAKGVPLKDEERDRAAMMASAVVNVEPRWSTGPSPVVRSVLEFARDSARRWLPADMVPDGELPVSGAEVALIDDAIRGVRETPLPQYLDDSTPREVRSCFKRHMDLKADLLSLWCLAVRFDEPRSRYWLGSADKKARLFAVLGEWKARGAAVRLLDRLTQPAGSCSASIP